MYREITSCRMTRSSQLVPILNLGPQKLSGVFPRSLDEDISTGPLELVLAREGGLLQLRQSFDPSEMYGENYGYRSGLNASMVTHLRTKAGRLESLARPASGDIVLDIGSNDATLLRSYARVGQRLGGIDPSAGKFRQYYPAGIDLVTDFFNPEAYRRLFGDGRAKIVTSIAMLYDLEDPLAFVRDVAAVLADDGIWHFEQSYMPAMLQACAYDTICHEHLEYYGLTQIQWMLDRAGLRIIDVEFNSVNGGSFAVTAALKGAPYESDSDSIDQVLQAERSARLDQPSAYDEFRARVFQHREELPSLIRQLQSDGMNVLGYGASTKGNVLLQFCGLTADDLRCIAEVNPHKFGCFTPGSDIPIVSENEARDLDPDYFLVLPWHFRENIVEREQQFLARGGKLIFPLPSIEIVGDRGTVERPSTSLAG